MLKGQLPEPTLTSAEQGKSALKGATSAAELGDLGWRL